MTDTAKTPKLSTTQQSAIRMAIGAQVDGRPNTVASLVRLGLVERRMERNGAGNMVARHYLTDAGKDVRMSLSGLSPDVLRAVTAPGKSFAQKVAEREAGIRAERKRLDAQKAEREAREQSLGGSGKGLTEHSVPVTDSGLRVGAPRDAEVKREAEIRQAAESGDLSRFNGTRDSAQGHGPAIFRGRNMAPVQPQRGYAAAAGTMAGPIGRPRFDREVTDVPMAGGRYGFLTPAEVGKLSRTQQRAYWRRVKANRDAGKRLVERSRAARKSSGK